MKVINNTQALRKTKLALAIGATLFISSNAMAAEEVADKKIKGLEVIQVTATKRSQSVQSVPMSITAINGDKIEKSAIQDLSEISDYVPNLSISENAINTNIFMRGVGSGNNRSFEQSVGMFIDGIYMGRSKQFRAPFLDLERAEILRGPQGILFGKNTIAGTLNLSTAKAEAGSDFEGKVIADFEPEYNSQGLTGVVSAGLTDELGFRLAVKDSSSDGYMVNNNLDQDEPQSEETIVRLSLHWQPTDDLSVHFKGENSETESVGSTSQFISAEPLDGLAAFILGAVIPSVQDDFETNLDDTRSSDDAYEGEFRGVEADNVAVNIDYDLAGGVLSYTGGYSAYESTEHQDLDYMPFPFLHTNDLHDFDQTSHEIRFASSLGGSFDYITGIYYSESDLVMDVTTHIDVAAITPALMPAYNAPRDALGGLSFTDIGFAPESLDRVSNFNQETETLSAFFQGTYHFTDALRLTVGGRYTDDTKDVFRQSAHGEVQLNHTFDNLIPADANSAFTAVALSVNVKTPEYTDSYDESHFTPSVKIQYDVNDDMMIYATAEEGFKAGGFNSDTAAAEEDMVFEDEEALGLELGMKSDFLDGQARLNVAVFHTTFDNLQVTSWTGTGFSVGNAAESTTQGVEVDGAYILSDNWTLSGSMSYLDSTYDDYANGPCTAPIMKDPVNPQTDCDLTGETTPFAPEMSASVFLDYETEIGSSLLLSARLNVNFSDEYFVDSDLDENLKQDSFSKVNMMVSLASVEDTWSVSLIGKNLTDETTFSAGLDTPLVAGGYIGYTDAPRTVTVQGTYNF
ncbi:TonB-dependent receptor [Thalassotalea psychrophila]|uniref:TonB-dependent receptor n=1 Tax=Thalassotalea psychrophila TaxID=3065647 RepID=A0ABY9TYY0_9GAMM|nr:TonB-dependent receptor [Colwelliaceae bacterium SQ149]